MTVYVGINRTVQWFNLKTRAKMSYHSDSWPGNGKPWTRRSLRSRAHRFSLSTFSTTSTTGSFHIQYAEEKTPWTRSTKQKLDYDNEDCVTMDDGMAMLWPQKEDHAFQHGVWPVSGRCASRMAVSWKVGASVP